jgi:uncharacterized protein (DUF1697 family)
MSAMAYAALLRAINVGGNSKVEMPRLRAALERIGLDRVRTYINSGNVVFSAPAAAAGRLRARIEAAIEAEFGFPVMTLIRTTEEMQMVMAALPDDWVTDREYRCEVLFNDDFTTADAVARLPFTAGIEETRFAPGAVIYRIRLDLRTRSRLTRMVGTDLYRQITARNSTTVRTLYSMLLSTDAAAGEDSDVTSVARS